MALLIVTAIAAVSIFLLNSEDKVSASNQVTDKKLLFVYNGENASLEPIGTSADQFTLSVPIASEESQITWFTDRPARDAGHMSYENFVRLFYSNEKNSFKEDPPNVAIQVEEKTLIATMTNPKIVGTAQGGRSLVADFVLVPQANKKDLLKEENFISSHITKSSQAESIGTARTLKWVSVFVDDLVSYTIYNAAFSRTSFHGSYNLSDPSVHGDFTLNPAINVDILARGVCKLIGNYPVKGGPIIPDTEDAISPYARYPRIWSNQIQDVFLGNKYDSLSSMMSCDTVTVLPK